MHARSTPGKRPFLRTYFLALPQSNLKGWWISALRDTYVSLRFVVAIRYAMRQICRPGGCQQPGMRCGRRSLAALRPPPWYTHVRIVTHVPKIISTYSRLRSSWPRARTDASAQTLTSDPSTTDQSVDHLRQMYVSTYSTGAAKMYVRISTDAPNGGRRKQCVRVCPQPRHHITYKRTYAVSTTYLSNVPYICPPTMYVRITPQALDDTPSNVHRQ